MATPPAVMDPAQLARAVKSGAAWFYWIAGLSMVNTVMHLSGTERGFVLGLGITQMVDGIMLGLAGHLGHGARIYGFFMNVGITGAAAVFGVFAGRRQGWAFVIGMILYALDGLIFLLVQEWFSLGFHGFALFCMFGGYQAHRRLSELERSTPAAAVPAPAPVPDPSPAPPPGDPANPARTDERYPFRPPAATTVIRCRGARPCAPTRGTAFWGPERIPRMNTSTWQCPTSNPPSVP